MDGVFILRKIEDKTLLLTFNDVLGFITHDALKYVLMAIVALALYKLGISNK